jgi:hypothetical protein
MGPFTDGLHSGAKYKASAVYEHKAHMTSCDPCRVTQPSFCGARKRL